jgi:hypothetical protein
MCCLFTTLVLFGPRLGILIWWLFDPIRWNLAFQSFFWPFWAATAAALTVTVIGFPATDNKRC